MSRRREALATRRSARGFTQLGLAQAVGVERSTVWRWEKGHITPLPAQRRPLATALGLSLDECDRLLSHGDHFPIAVCGTNPADNAEESHQHWDEPMRIRHRLLQLMASNVAASELASLDHRVRQILRSSESTDILAPRAANLRAHVHELMSGHHRLNQRLQLYRIGAEVSGLLGQLAASTRRFRLAETYCEEALYLAEEIGDVELLRRIREICASIPVRRPR